MQPVEAAGGEEARHRVRRRLRSGCGGSRARRARRERRPARAARRCAASLTTSTPAGKLERRVRAGDHQPADAVVRQQPRGPAQAGRSDRSPRAPGSGPATRRTVNCGSSASAVPTPTTTASTSARRRCRWASPSAPVDVVRVSAGGGDAGVDRLAALARPPPCRRPARGAAARKSPARAAGVKTPIPGASVELRPTYQGYHSWPCRGVTCSRGFFRIGRHRVMIFGEGYRENARFGGDYCGMPLSADTVGAGDRQ